MQSRYLWPRQRAGRGLERLETGRRERGEESVSEDSLQGANRGTLCTPVAGPKAECQAIYAVQYQANARGVKLSENKIWRHLSSTFEKLIFCS